MKGYSAFFLASVLY